MRCNRRCIPIHSSLKPFTLPIHVVHHPDLSMPNVRKYKDALIDVLEYLFSKVKNPIMRVYWTCASSSPLRISKQTQAFSMHDSYFKVTVTKKSVSGTQLYTSSSINNSYYRISSSQLRFPLNEPRFSTSISSVYRTAYAKNIHKTQQRA